jgi:hypothetical protein
MLTAKQYEAVGRLTLSFNYHITNACEGSQPIPQGQGFTRFVDKTKKFRKIMTATQAKFPMVQCVAGSISEVLTEAQGLAKERNKYAHALVFMDFHFNEAKLKNRVGEVPCDEEDIRKLAIQAASLAERLARQCDQLLEMLELHCGPRPASLIESPIDNEEDEESYD